MTKPPIRKTTNFVQVKVRLPPDLHSEILAACELNGGSIATEVIARLRERQVEDLRREVAELKVMVRELLDMARDKW